MTLNSQNLAFADTHFFSNLIIDYINQDEKILGLTHYKFNIDAIQQAISDKSKEYIDRQLLADTVLNQYKNISNSNSVLSQINLLRDEATFCVVTAHQLNIFGGPLYYIYKIAQTISTCKQLKIKYPNYNFVPVYWLGSEDHDFEEINHVFLYGNKLEWTDKQGGATGNYSTHSIFSLIDDLEAKIGNEPHGKNLISIFKNAYTNNDLSTATRIWVNAIFAEYGLLVIDGNDAVFKQQFASIMQDDLLTHNAYQLALNTIKQIENNGYKAQAMPRPINLFYLTKNSRERIEYDEENKRFVVLNTAISFSQNELLKELELYPQRFSPNVILRPLYQQKILPSIAYIGGGGEIAYWLQLKSVFENYNVNFPQLIVRNSALLCNENTQSRMEKLQISIKDLFHSIDDIKKQYIQQQTDFSIEQELTEIENQFKNIQSKVAEIDASLVNYVGAEYQKTNKAVAQIKERVHKSLKQKNETALNQLEKLKNQLFPNANLQERVENFSSYYATYGSSFIEQLIEVFDVYDKEFLILNLYK